MQMDERTRKHTIQTLVKLTRKGAHGLDNAALASKPLRDEGACTPLYGQGMMSQAKWPRSMLAGPQTVGAKPSSKKATWFSKARIQSS